MKGHIRQEILENLKDVWDEEFPAFLAERRLHAKYIREGNHEGEYIGCPECGELTWSVDLGYCVDCGFID